MITLITGTPGSGKTAWLLDQLLTLKKNEPTRLLYVHGVRNLRGITHQTIYCKSQLCDICRSNAELKNWEESLRISSPTNEYLKYKYVEDWPSWKQPNSLIVVDEVQRIWRPRTGGSVPHASVSGLETHRHYGVDFWLISQGPHLFDNFIRLLVGRHVHLVANWAGRKQYEWPECKQDVQSRADAVVRPYTLPKRVFSLYDSAEVHTKLDKRKPISFYVSIAALLIAVAVVYVISGRISNKINPDLQQEAGAGGAAAHSAPVSSTNQSGKVHKIPLETPEQIAVAYTPVVSSMPWTAPIYAELAKPTVFPVVAGCVKSATDCRCYTQQATRVEMAQDMCQIFVKNHTFNQFKVAQNENKVELAQKSDKFR